MPIFEGEEDQVGRNPSTPSVKPLGVVQFLTQQFYLSGVRTASGSDGSEKNQTKPNPGGLCALAMDFEQLSHPAEGSLPLWKVPYLGAR